MKVLGMLLQLMSGLVLGIVAYVLSGVAQDTGSGHVVPTRTFSFPKDDGSHPEFALEWWYFTGTLYGVRSDGARAVDPIGGFQLAFFRKHLLPTPGTNPRQGFLAHAAFTEFETGAFLFSSQEAVGSVGLAGASESGLRVWNSGWTAEEVGNSVVLRFDIGEGAVKKIVRLVLSKPDPWLQGTGGASAKGSCPECFSFYYSRPRMKIDGTVESGGESRRVVGTGWMDHEFMNNVLRPEDAGWDWFGLMIDDDTELMLFRIRARDGETRFLSGALRRKGASTMLTASDVQVEPLQFWKSPTTGASYPVRWRLAIPKSGIETTISARVDSQELVFPAGSSSPTYWEGAVASEDEKTIGYLEMTGYTKPLGASLTTVEGVEAR